MKNDKYIKLKQELLSLHASLNKTDSYLNDVITQYAHTHFLKVEINYHTMTTLQIQETPAYGGAEFASEICEYKLALLL